MWPPPRPESQAPRDYSVHWELALPWSVGVTRYPSRTFPHARTAVSPVHSGSVPREKAMCKPWLAQALSLELGVTSLACCLLAV